LKLLFGHLLGSLPIKKHSLFVSNSYRKQSLVEKPSRKQSHHNPSTEGA